MDKVVSDGADDAYLDARCNTAERGRTARARTPSLSVAVVPDTVFEGAYPKLTPLADTTETGLRLPPELIGAVAGWRGTIVLVPDLACVLD